MRIPAVTNYAKLNSEKSLLEKSLRRMTGNNGATLELIKLQSVSSPHDFENRRLPRVKGGNYQKSRKERICFRM